MSTVLITTFSCKPLNPLLNDLPLEVLDIIRYSVDIMWPIIERQRSEVDYTPLNTT